MQLRLKSTHSSPSIYTCTFLLSYPYTSLISHSFSKDHLYMATTKRSYLTMPNTLNRYPPTLKTSVLQLDNDSRKTASPWRKQWLTPLGWKHVCTATMQRSFPRRVVGSNSTQGTTARSICSSRFKALEPWDALYSCSQAAKKHVGCALMMLPNPDNLTECSPLQTLSIFEQLSQQVGLAKQIYLICYIFPRGPWCKFPIAFDLLKKSRWPLVQVWKTRWRQIALLTVSRSLSSIQPNTISLPPSCSLCLCFISINAGVSSFQYHTGRLYIHKCTIDLGGLSSKADQPADNPNSEGDPSADDERLSRPRRCRLSGDRRGASETSRTIFTKPSSGSLPLLWLHTDCPTCNGDQRDQIVEDQIEIHFSRVLRHFWGQSEEIWAFGSELPFSPLSNSSMDSLASYSHSSSRSLKEAIVEEEDDFPKESWCKMLQLSTISQSRPHCQIRMIFKTDF